jgi:hypothetical protein
MAFSNVNIAGGANLGQAAISILGNLQINFGGFVNTGTGPIYGSNSKLIYNIGTNYGRTNEWNASTAGSIGSTTGFPNDVQVTGGTILDLANGNLAAKYINRDFTVDAGSSVNMGAMTGSLFVPRDFSLAGSFTQSSAFGGDVVIGRHWSSFASASLTANNRDVRFNGSALQQITAANTLVFGFLTIDNSAASVDLLSNITVFNFRVNSGRIFNLSTDKITISASGGVTNDGTFNANSGTIEYLNGGNFTNNSVFNRGTSTLDFNGFAPINFVSIIGSVQTSFHNIRCFSGGGIDFGTGPLRGRLFGTLELRAGSFIANNSC